VNFFDRIKTTQERKPNPNFFECPISGQNAPVGSYFGGGLERAHVSNLTLTAWGGHTHILSSPRGQGYWTVDGV